MAQQAQVCITGYVGKDPDRVGREGGDPICSFRLATTRSFWNRKTGGWQDAPTTWIRVKAFRSLALNALKSLKKGDAVIVVGTLVTDEWERDGVTRSSLSIEANAIGHDLNRGVTSLMRLGGGSGNSGDDGGDPAAVRSGGSSTGSGTASNDPYTQAAPTEEETREFASFEQGGAQSISQPRQQPAGTDAQPMQTVRVA